MEHSKQTKVMTGLENLINNPPAFMKGKRVGLLSNPASVDRQFTHAVILMERAFPGQLKALFSPQHGFFGEKQDNMIESEHGVHKKLGIPIFSLYSETRRPTQEMFDLIDILVVDIQDVGTRVYTFIYTISYCMEKAAELGKKIVILDRPNPLGGEVTEGNILEKEYTSFVGRYPIPMRHGLTVGEMAKLFNRQFTIGCDLYICSMKGWKRSMHFNETGLPWLAPSPNLPTPASALVYPGQVIFEGTNISEGRGTTLPFEQFGAPFMEPDRILADFPDMPGVHLRPVSFEPTSNKWQHEVCMGFQIHVTDPKTFRPFLLSMTLLQKIATLYPKKFSWKTPPYEYEFDRLPMDLILGSQRVRQNLVGRDLACQNLTGKISLADMNTDWKEQRTAYWKICRDILMYD